MRNFTVGQLLRLAVFGPARYESPFGTQIGRDKSLTTARTPFIARQDPDEGRRRNLRGRTEFELPLERGAILPEDLPQGFGGHVPGIKVVRPDPPRIQFDVNDSGHPMQGAL